MRVKVTTCAAALVVVGSLVASGCGSGSGESQDASSTASSGKKGDKTVALFLPENKTPRYESKDRPDFTRKLKAACPDCKLLYYNAGQDAAKQQQQVEAALTQRANLLVLDPVDSASAAAMVARAKQATVPVIAYSRPILKADIDYFVSNDNFAVGKLQGQALVDRLKQLGKPNGRIVMINGAPTDANAGDFKRGAHSVIDTSGLKVVAEYDTPDWSPDKAQQEMEQAITKVGRGNIDGVYAANDGTAGGAIAAMKAAGIKPLPPVTGQDADLAAIQHIVSGDQYMTVYKAITPQAEAAAELAAAVVQGKRPPAGLVTAKLNNGAKDVPSVFTPIQVVTTDTVQSTVVADKFWKPSQICTGAFAAACAKAGIK